MKERTTLAKPSRLLEWPYMAILCAQVMPPLRRILSAGHVEPSACDHWASNRRQGGSRPASRCFGATKRQQTTLRFLGVTAFRRLGRVLLHIQLCIAGENSSGAGTLSPGSPRNFKFKAMNLGPGQPGSLLRQAFVARIG